MYVSKPCLLMQKTFTGTFYTFFLIIPFKQSFNRFPYYSIVDIEQKKWRNKKSKIVFEFRIYGKIKKASVYFVRNDRLDVFLCCILSAGPSRGDQALVSPERPAPPQRK